jgi:hypothetical protein
MSTTPTPRPTRKLSGSRRSIRRTIPCEVGEVSCEQSGAGATGMDWSEHQVAILMALIGTLLILGAAILILGPILTGR